MFISFMVLSASNKEEIASLQRLFEAQEKKNRKITKSLRRIAEPGTDPSDGYAVAPERWSLAQDCQVAAQWRKETGAMAQPR
jgi:hypothetical protein